MAALYENRLRHLQTNTTAQGLRTLNWN